MKSRPLALEEFKRAVVPAFRAVFRDPDPFGEPFRDSIASKLLLYPVSYRLEDDQIDALASAAAAVGDDGFYVVETEHAAQWRELLENPPEPTPPDLTGEWVKFLPPEALRTTWAQLNRGGLASDYSDAPAWYFALSDLRPWKEVGDYPGSTLETGLISATGRWGMLISHESHAVVGGSELFIETLADSFPALSDSIGRDPDGEWRYREEPVPPRDQIVVFLKDVKGHWKEPMTWLPRHLTHLYGESEANALLQRIGFIA